MKTIILSPLFAALWMTSAMAQAPDAAARTTQTFPGGSARDGFTLRGAEMVMTRSGVTTKVDKDYAFPNGMRVMANGNIILRDGSTTVLRPNQLLTFEGDFRDVALTQDGVAAVSSSDLTPAAKPDIGISSRDGITVSGADVLITRNGVTERVSADVRLPNGVIVRSDGTVTLNNGNKITLRPTQVLGLDGILREAPVRPSPPGPSPASSNPR